MEKIACEIHTKNTSFQSIIYDENKFSLEWSADARIPIKIAQYETEILYFLLNPIDPKSK